MRLKFTIILLLIIAGISDMMALSGAWRGKLNIGPTELPLVFNFSTTPEGKTVATMDSPMQNVTGIPVEVIYSTADSLNLECSMIRASYCARISDGRIEGTFSQSGYNLPLILTPDDDLQSRRPQTPVPPFPYSEKEILFKSSDGTELAGTLIFPEVKEGNTFPIVVMATGSGPQNRDEEIFEHRPFAVIADYLARNGIGSLRFDDRGTAKSKGNYNEAIIDTFKEDLRSAYKYAKGLPEAGKTGILGHSEGGTLALLIASEETPDFIISLAGVSVPLKETLVDQNRRSLEKSDLDEARKKASLRLVELMFDEISDQYSAGKSSSVDIDSICRENSLDVPEVVLNSLRQSDLSRSRYLDSLVALDPSIALEKIECPVLAINGDKDVQVDADRNLECFRKCVKNVDVRKLPGLNHLMQHAETGEITEYSEIKETISPEVLSIITDFIKGI